MTAKPDTRLLGGKTAIPAKLAVTRLTVTNFRSYAAAELNNAGAAVVLAGPNGAGKTNLLDAISLLAPGRGLRAAKLAEHIRKGPMAPSEALWAVAATVKRGETDYDIGTGLSEQSTSRHVRLNGVEAKGSAELGEVVQMVWLTPAMDRLFIESASGRRRFLDRLVLGFDASHARAATRYETAMRERARLLKCGPRDPQWLGGLENEMADAGILVAQARQAAVARLNSALATRVGAFPAASLTLAEEIHADADALRGALAKSRIRDAESGRTLVGPHVTDLVARHVQKRADARDCSTGEQKALLISIMLAFARELTKARDGLAPLLLLDEVAAHLDRVRRDALFEEIADLKAQAWMTGTDLSLFENARAQIFEVRDGTFREVGREAGDA
ncbi:MAG TPA: DNA replication/repair protein RecF [Rhizomicrobium sp.]|nr:DNA replication/repair protein RecF [Rhizomicrobium sp.]